MAKKTGTAGTIPACEGIGNVLYLGHKMTTEISQNPSDKAALQSEITDLILTSVNLRHKDKSTITAETALVGEGLGLDSLDMLEIVVAMEKKYNVKIEGADQGKVIFKNIGTLTDFILLNKSELRNH